jgi:hypothetical protein
MIAIPTFGRSEKTFCGLRIEALIDYILMQIPCKNKGFLAFPNNNSNAHTSRVRKQKPSSNGAAQENHLRLGDRAPIILLLVWT